MTPSAKVAQQIVAGWGLAIEDGHRVEVIIQQAIDASLRARDAEIEGLAQKWRAEQVIAENSHYSHGYVACSHDCADQLEAALSRLLEAQAGTEKNKS